MSIEENKALVERMIKEFTLQLHKFNTFSKGVEK